MSQFATLHCTWHCMLPYVIMSSYNVDIHVHVQLHIMYMCMYWSACTCMVLLIIIIIILLETAAVLCMWWLPSFGVSDPWCSLSSAFSVCVCVCVYWVEVSPGNVIYMYTCTCMLLIWAVLLWLVPNISDSIWLHNTLYVCVCVCVCVCVWAAYA